MRAASRISQSSSLSTMETSRSMTASGTSWVGRAGRPRPWPAPSGSRRARRSAPGRARPRRGSPSCCASRGRADPPRRSSWTSSVMAFRHASRVDALGVRAQDVHERADAAVVADLLERPHAVQSGVVVLVAANQRRRDPRRGLLPPIRPAAEHAAARTVRRLVLERLLDDLQRLLERCLGRGSQGPAHEEALGLDGGRAATRRQLGHVLVDERVPPRAQHACEVALLPLVLRLQRLLEELLGRPYGALLLPGPADRLEGLPAGDGDVGEAGPRSPFSISGMPASTSLRSAASSMAA